MESSDLQPGTAPQAKTVAAIDIGSNAIRLVIAQVGTDGVIEVLERLQRPVRMGQDTFRRGHLGGQSMRAATAIFRDCRRVIDLYKAERIRAVATSAVREAVNADNFLDRLFMATRLNVEVIATSEESRLTVSAVRQALAGAAGVEKGKTLIVDVGGGSTLLTVLEDGRIANSAALRLGSIRLQENLATGEETPKASVDLLRHHIKSTIDTAERSLSLRDVRSIVALGGDSRFAAREVGKPADSGNLTVVPLDKFEKLLRRCTKRTPEELSKRHGLTFAEAETLNPALLVYEHLLKSTGAKEMIVSNVSMRDGLLLDLARSVTGEEDEALLEGVTRSAMALAVKYRVDPDHARCVAEIAVRLFDELTTDHGLTARHRLLLHVAGLLHESGGFISSQAHHKHSYYLIRHAEIFGLNRDEVGLVAHIARYHRRSAPKLSHLDYVSMPRESRVVVAKLAAMLRVADSLSRGNISKPKTLQFERAGDELVIHVPGGSDLIIERRSLTAKGKMFEDIYGMKVRLEEA